MAAENRVPASQLPLGSGLPAFFYMQDSAGNAFRRYSFENVSALLGAVGITGPAYMTRAELFADLNWPANTLGFVGEDPDPTRRGIYRKNLAEGLGTWTRIGPLTTDFTALYQALQAAIDDFDADATEAQRILAEAARTGAEAAEAQAEIARDAALAAAAGAVGGLAVGFATRTLVEAYAPVSPPSVIYANGEIAGGDGGAAFAQYAGTTAPKAYGGNLVDEEDLNLSALWSGTGWTVLNGKAAHNGGGTTPLAYAMGAYGNPALDKFVAAQVYLVQTFISGRTAGTVTPKIVGGTTAAGVAVSVNGFNEQLITAPAAAGAPPTFALNFTPTTDFDGSITYVAVRVQLALPAAAVYHLVLADAVTNAWYLRRPDKITPFHCGATRVDDADNLTQTSDALQKAAEWGQTTGIEVFIPPGLYLFDAGNHKTTQRAFFPTDVHSAGTDVARASTGLTLRGAGLSTVLKNLGSSWDAILSLDEAKRVTVEQLVLDANFRETFIVDDVGGGMGGVDLNGQGFILGQNGITEKVRFKDLVIIGTRSYAIALENNDATDTRLENIHVRGVGNDGIDIKARNGSRIHRKEATFLHNIYVEEIDLVLGGAKAGIDIRGHVIADGLYVTLTAGRTSDGVRFNADVDSDNGRKGARKSQATNIYVVDNSGVVATADNNRGLSIFDEFINVANVVVEGAGVGILIDSANDSVANGVSVTNAAVIGARTIEGDGQGIRLDSTSGAKGFHIEAVVSDCDVGLGPGATGFPVKVSGSILLQSCTKGHSLTLAQLVTAMDLVIGYDGNTTNNDLSVVQSFMMARAATGPARLLFEAISEAGTADIDARFWRSSPTSGKATVDGYVPNSGTIDWRLASQGSDYWLALAAALNVGIGTITPGVKLDVVGVIRASLGIVHPGYTAAELGAIGNAVNTANKRLGSTVHETTNGRIMVSQGALANSAWKGDGATITPA